MLDLVRIGDRREVINRGAIIRHEYGRTPGGAVCLVLRFGGGATMRLGGEVGPCVHALGLP